MSVKKFSSIGLAEAEIFPNMGAQNFRDKDSFKVNKLKHLFFCVLKLLPN